MKLLVITQVLDRDDPILGFAHGWMEALSRHVERLIVVPLKKGVVDLPANVEVRSLGKEDGRGTLGVLAGFARVVGGACRRRETDAILAHMVPRFAVYAAPFAVPRRIPLFLWYTHATVDWSLRLAVPLVAKAFTASDRSFRLATRKKVVLGHGIDTRAFRPPEPGDPEAKHDIAVVGRIAPRKDPLTLVEALGLLKADGVTPRVVFAGGTLLAEHDEYERKVLARIDALGVRDQCTFLGAVPHPRIREVFVSAPLFVTPSLTGSVDKTVLEAMSCARIPITCNDSFDAVLGPYAPRLMFPPGDARALAARLKDLLAVPHAVRDRLGGELRKIVVRDHDLENLATRMVAEIASDPPRSR